MAIPPIAPQASPSPAAAAAAAGVATPTVPEADEAESGAETDDDADGPAGRTTPPGSARRQSRTPATAPPARPAGNPAARSLTGYTLRLHGLGPASSAPRGGAAARPRRSVIG